MNTNTSLNATLKLPKISTHAVFCFSDVALLGRLGVSTASWPLIAYQSNAEAIADATTWAVSLGAETIEVLSRDEPEETHTPEGVRDICEGVCHADLATLSGCDICGEVCTCVPNLYEIKAALNTAINCGLVEGQFEEGEEEMLEWLLENLHRLYES